MDSLEPSQLGNEQDDKSDVLSAKLEAMTPNAAHDLSPINIDKK